MRFIKGMIIGSALTVGIAMMYTEGIVNKKRMMRTGRKIAKKMGVM